MSDAYRRSRSKWAFQGLVAALLVALGCAWFVRVGSARADLKVGALQADEPLDRIEVTISIGDQGEPLSEAVDLHLGLGFPLRLFPLGSDKHAPAFAAFPTKSSLPKGETSLQPGQKATFEFTVKPDDTGLDPLRSTQELFRDLKEGDPRKIGFASLGKSDWALSAYEIKANGRLLASNDGLDLRPFQLQRENQARLQEKVDQFELLLREANALEATALTGLATESELARLQTTNDELEALADEINTLAARILGALPWHTEPGDKFPAVPQEGDPIRTLDVLLTPLDRPQAGSRNPLYLWIDGRKFSLTTEADPLADSPAPQSFRIPASELDANPIVRQRVKEIGIGMVANDDPQGALPDRARLRRVQIFADDQPLYDSEKVPGDRDVLRRLALIPPAHRTDKGKVKVDTPTAGLVTLWKSGSLLPEGTPADPEFPPEKPVEPPADEPFVSTDEPLPEDLIDPLPTDPETEPGLPPPVAVLVPFDEGGLNSPRRRRPRRRGGRTPINLTINVPSATAPARRRKRPGTTNAAGNPAGTNTAPGGPATPRPVVPTPAPAAPVLSSIRVNPAIPILRDGDASTVTWQVSGNTANVANYRVDLFGVLPHKNPPLINTPLATVSNIPPQGSGTQNMQTRVPAISVNKIQGQLSGAEAQYLYVQPKVTALGTNGTAVVSGFGSILPLFPAGTSSPYNGALRPGQLVLNGAFVGNAAPPPAFQILPAGAAALPWKSSPATDPGTVSTSWPINGEQDSSYALTFASYVPSLGAVALPSYNTAARPATNGERIAIQYEAPVPLPSVLSTPAKGWRVVGHVAFLGGTAPATALVQTRVNLYARPASPTPFFTMQTPRAPIAYNKYSSGTTPAPCLLIDMPVRFDLMPRTILASSPHDATKYAITSFVPGGANGFASVGNAGGGAAVYLQMTVMIAQQATTTTDAVGVFGLRLVPDNN